jgi:hypothetical protein
MEPGSIEDPGYLITEYTTICPGGHVSNPTRTSPSIENGRKENCQTHEIIDVPYNYEYQWLPSEPAAATFENEGSYQFELQVTIRPTLDDPDCPPVGPETVGTFTVLVQSCLESGRIENPGHLIGSDTITICPGDHVMNLQLLLLDES